MIDVIRLRYGYGTHACIHGDLAVVAVLVWMEFEGINASFGSDSRLEIV